MFALSFTLALLRLDCRPIDESPVLTIINNVSCAEAVLTLAATKLKKCR